MCKGGSHGETEEQQPPARARCVGLTDGAWVVGLTIRTEDSAQQRLPDTRFHFVLDNSSSMGSTSRLAKECFSELVEVATGPCSLIAFHSKAELLGEDFRTAEALREVALPRQGGTNITAGVEASLGIVRRCPDTNVHHVLVLLSDGAHMIGPRPEERLPACGAELRAEVPSLRLSVVVVGVTSNSNTSMGMQLKQSLETVALPSLEPIYFAYTPQLMRDVLKQLHGGLETLRGSLVEVAAPDGHSFVRAVGEAAVSSVDLLVQDREHALLCSGGGPPPSFTVDGVKVLCTAAGDFDADLAVEAVQALVNAVRVKRVAEGAAGVKSALQHVETLIAALEAKEAEQRSQDASLHLAGATPAQRLAQHRALKRATQGARELRNQLADIQACAANDSASQAAFLTGAASKYGAKALRRGAGGEDSQERLQEMLSEVERLASKMKLALRKDFCAKLSTLSAEQRQQLRGRLVAAAPAHSSFVDQLCRDAVEADSLGEELAEFIDEGTALAPLLAVLGSARQSYLSLQTPWAQLKEWSDAGAHAASVCRSEYQLLMFLGALGYPIDVQRRAATQMDPFAMAVTRVRTAPADTASLCTALQSDQTVVPPEGGLPVKDLLLLVDPDSPRASKIAVSSTLLKEAYTSVVLCRDLHMYSGDKMRLALHAHALLAAAQPPNDTSRADLEAQMQRQYLGRAFQCASCGFGPIDHFACGDLAAHHGEVDISGAVVSNACPNCDWFSHSLGDWPRWDGTLPAAALDAASSGSGSAAATGGCATSASLEVALRICYSARALWSHGEDSEARILCEKLANWETITAADGVGHPVQLLIALAIVDDVPEGALGEVSMLSLLNEVCARRARDQLRQRAGTDENAVNAAARRCVADFLGVTAESAPQTVALEQSEPQREAVHEQCCGDWTLDAAAFDFEEWVRGVLLPWVPALLFVQRLRATLAGRAGGWAQLEHDMEAGPSCYTDVVQALRRPLQQQEVLKEWLGAERDMPRVCATVAAQAFLHHSSQLRRLKAAGGSLREPLGDVRDSATLRAIAVDLRMATYDERVAAKMREWGKLGENLTFQSARAADLEQYADLCRGHVHGLDKATFWGLWRAATGEKVRAFLRTANREFVNKYGDR